MAFMLARVNDGHVPPWEYLPCSAITPKVGMAMVLSSGKLAKCGATAKPEFICMREESAAVSAGDIVPVIRVDEDQTFETTNTASFASINIGDVVTLHTDGLQVTATKTDGVAKVVGMDGTATGSKIKVKF